MGLNGMNKAEAKKLDRMVRKLMTEGQRVRHVHDRFKPTPEGSYRILTKAGILSISPIDGAIFCRFECPELASQILFGRQVGTSNPTRLNGYSGKWNFHWFKPRKRRGEQNVAPGPKLTAAYAFAEFQRELEPLLHIYTAAEQEADASAAANHRELIDDAFRILDGTEWNADTTSALSDLLQCNGMQIPRDPNEVEDDPDYDEDGNLKPGVGH